MASGIAGEWDAKWSDGTKARYSINYEDSSIIVLSCDWYKCTKYKKATITTSTSSSHPASDGWLEARGLHSEHSRVYFKKEGKRVKVIWHPATAWLTKGM